MNSIYGFDVLSIIPRKFFYNGEFTNKPLQSVCFDEKNKKFIVGFSQRDNSNYGTLVRMSNFDFCVGKVEKIQSNLTIGHCNDMAYSKQLHKIFIARGDNKIAVVNPDSFDVERLITIDMVAWQISMYDDGSFFVSDSDKSVHYDADFKNKTIINEHNLRNLVDVLHLQYDSVDQSYAGDWQGSFILDDIPYLIYTEWNGITDAINGDTRYKSCVLFSPADKSVRRFPTFQEVENACVIGNQLYFAIGNEYIGVGLYEIDCKEVHFDTARTVHEEIAVGADLDMMFTPKRYRSKNAKKSQTIKHLPNISSVKEAGFTLDIENTGLNHIRQTIYSNNFWTPDFIYVRGFNYDYGWGEWYCLSANNADKNHTYQISFAKFENIKVPTGNTEKCVGGSVTLDFSPHVPDGYGLYSANIDCEYQGKYYTLPFVNDYGKCTLRILRIVDNQITIRSNDDWGTCTFWVTGFCKRIK